MKGLISLAVVLAAWQAAGAAGWLNPYLLPPPTEIARAFRELAADGVLLDHTLASLWRVLVGLFYACLAALPLGVLAASNRQVRGYLQPLVELLRPIPPIAWIPLAVLWFGVRGDRASNFITFVAAFFPLFLHTFSGIRHIEALHLDAARALGAGRRMLLLDVALPSALPFIVTGFRLSLGFAWMCVIAAELIASNSGLGYMIEINRSMLNTANVICGMITIGAVGFVMNWAILALERRFSWRPLQ
ncbi:MAG: ABC transporter permease [Elusimicrobiales bacterium]|nr:ABC transporter permease [Elusimicrobiales bacterium]